MALENVLDYLFEMNALCLTKENNASNFENIEVQGQGGQCQVGETKLVIIIPGRVLTCSIHWNHQAEFLTS